jgi:hypothetical protein
MPKRKEKIGTITTQVKAGINPNRTNLLGETRIKGIRTPRRGNNNRCQGRNNNTIRTTFPCSLCGEFGHYTHHFPQITDFKQLKVLGSLPHPPALPAPHQAPQKYVQQPPSAMM